MLGSLLVGTNGPSTILGRPTLLDPMLPVWNTGIVHVLSADAVVQDPLTSCCDSKMRTHDDLLVVIVIVQIHARTSVTSVTGADLIITVISDTLGPERLVECMLQQIQSRYDMGLPCMSSISRMPAHRHLGV